MNIIILILNIVYSQCFVLCICCFVYIYVHPKYRLMGFGRKLVKEVQRITGKVGLPHEPVSPMGQRFFAALEKYS